MAKNKFEILEKKVDLLIKGRRQRLSIPQFNSLLKDIEEIEVNRLPIGKEEEKE